jgi:hypothetical protein
MFHHLSLHQNISSELYDSKLKKTDVKGYSISLILSLFDGMLTDYFYVKKRTEKRQ